MQIKGRLITQFYNQISTKFKGNSQLMWLSMSCYKLRKIIWKYVLKFKVCTLLNQQYYFLGLCPAVIKNTCIGNSTSLRTAVLLLLTSAQLCLTLCDPMDCSQPGSSVHGIFPGKNTAVGCRVLLQGIFPTPGQNPGLLRLLHWQASSLPLVPPGSLRTAIRL